MLKIGTACSGIGSPEQALKNLKIPHSIEYAIEIDKHAKKTYLLNHESKLFFDDITKINPSELPSVDIFVAGFPCQAFSIAGNRKGFEDTRGTIFFNILEILKETQPSCFILENVKGLLNHDNGRTFETIINSLSNNSATSEGQLCLFPNVDSLNYNVYYKVLNAKNYGVPQNRERIFIIGFKDEVDFKFPKTQPLKYFLKDLLEQNVKEKYYVSDTVLKKLLKDFIPQNNQDYLKIDKQGNVKTNQEIASCLTGGGNSGGNHSDMDLLVMFNTGKNPQSNRVYSSETIACCQNSGSGGLGGKTGLYAIPVITPDKVNKRQNGRRFKNDKEMFTLTSQDRHGIYDGYRIRRLTPLECFRLMGFLDDFKKEVSETQLYKQAGNSIVVSVLEAILNNVISVLNKTI